MEKNPIVVECVDCENVMEGPSKVEELRDSWTRLQCDNCGLKSSLSPVYNDDGSFRRLRDKPRMRTV